MLKVLEGGMEVPKEFRVLKGGMKVLQELKGEQEEQQRSP